MRVDLRKYPIWIPTVFFLLYFSTALSSEIETVKFTFSPGNNISFLQKLTIIQEKELGTTGARKTESISTTKIRITRTDSGWDVFAEPESMSMKQEGKEVKNLVASLLSSIIITYKLDPDGNILDVSGYEPFIEGLSRKLPAEVLKKLSPMLNIDAMKAKEVAEWNGRFGDYIGTEVRIGDSFSADVPYKIPNGPTINYRVRTNIAAFTPCGNKTCVRIELDYDSQADGLAKMTGEIISNFTEEAEPDIKSPDSDSNVAAIKGKVTRVIDPKTMLIYREDSSRTVTMVINLPGTGAVPVKITESRKYEFEY